MNLDRDPNAAMHLPADIIDYYLNPKRGAVPEWPNQFALMLSPIVTQHMLGPIHVEIQGNRATATCHVRGYHYSTTAPSGSEWMVAGHYVFELAQQPTSWKITKLTLRLFYQTGNKNLLQEAAKR